MDDIVTDEEREAEYAVITREELVREILQEYEGKIQYDVNKYGRVSVKNSRVDFLACWDIEYHMKGQPMYIRIMDDNDYKKVLKMLFESDDDTCEKCINEMIAERKILRFDRS